MNPSGKLSVGLIHYYYGNGRGKTSTSIGTIIRALGHGLKPILIQFLKLHDERKKHQGFFIGEIHFLKELIPIKQFGAYSFIYPDKELDPDDIKRAQNGINYAREVINSKKYDLVVLDEVVQAVAFKLINLKDLLEILENKPKKVEVIVTGASYIKELIDISHYCTRFNCVDHPYYFGYQARSGIEF